MTDITQMAVLPFSEQWARHRWALELEDGRARLICLDPCDTFECTPDCATRTDPKVIENLGAFRVIEHQEVCNCGQYAKFREAFDAAEGRLCACMLTGEETDLVTGQLEIAIEFVDDSSPGGPWGPAEYSHYLVAHSIPPQHAPNPAFGGRTRDEQAWRVVMAALPEAQGELREALIDLGNAVAWDDAVHIAAPWEPRSSLCGNWNRNLVSLEDPRPDGVSGCWTCLHAADWFERAKVIAT